jgi:hypothetical protein
LPKEHKYQSDEKFQTGNQSNDICVAVDPGICGFPCLITARMLDARMVSLKISGSECKQIQRLTKRLGKISMPELFTPVSRNPVYLAAEKSGCHTSCVIPAAVLKAVEVAMGMALPREVRITFEPCQGNASNDNQRNCAF